jgi:hypothetical protein
MTHVCHLNRQVVICHLAIIAFLGQLYDKSARLLVIELNVLEFGLCLVDLLPRLLDFSFQVNQQLGALLELFIFLLQLIFQLLHSFHELLLLIADVKFCL